MRMRFIGAAGSVTGSSTLVETGRSESPEAEEAAQEYISPLISAGCRILILGCTHYPFLIAAVKKAAGPEVTIIDPAEETALEAANILSSAGILSSQETEPTHTYFTSARPEKFAELGSRFLGKTLSEVQQVEWGSDLQEIKWQEKTVEQTMKSAL